MKRRILEGAITATLAVSASGAWATCADVPRDLLEAAISYAETFPGGHGNPTGGYGLPMWATVVDETGAVCHVATSGDPGKFAGNTEWLGSRVISAQKANTANAFSLDGYAISTANLHNATEETGSLFGLQHSNPVDASQGYLGNPDKYGTHHDPLKGKRIGGINVFGGGLALYKNGKKIGALGVSGDTSCRDHAYAWRMRENLQMHPVGIVGITTSNMNAAGDVQTPLKDPSLLRGDEMIISGGGSNYWEAWSQPACPNSKPASLIPANGTLQIP